MRNGALVLQADLGFSARLELPYLALNLALSSEHKRQITQSTMACFICDYLIS